MRKVTVFITCMLLAVVVLMFGQVAYAQDQMHFATVVKSVAFDWFMRMEEGVLQFGEDYNVRAFMEGPSVADSAKQIAIIENLIAMGVDAIINVPYGVVEHEPVQKKAMDAGIVVITHEASFVENAHYDLEAFDNKAYGEEMMIELARRMGEKGKYVQFVGSLTNASHMEWMDGALAYQLEHYPEMESIGRFESKEDQEVVYNTIKDLLKTHTDLVGMLGGSALDVVGAGRAFEELGISDDTVVVGTSIVSYAGELLKTGAVDLAMLWDPATAGMAANMLAYKVIMGEEIVDGMDLGVPGYESIKIILNEHGVPVVYGEGWVKIDATNMDQYQF